LWSVEYRKCNTAAAASTTSNRQNNKFNQKEMRKGEQQILIDQRVLEIISWLVSTECELVAI
jgi:hypothetical protein